MIGWLALLNEVFLSGSVIIPFKFKDAVFLWIKTFDVAIGDILDSLV